jgi:hypothetical protein
MVVVLSTIIFGDGHWGPPQRVAAIKDAARLFDDLLSDYNKLVRPVDDNNATLIVKFKLKLSQLLDVVRFSNKFFQVVVLGSNAKRHKNSPLAAEAAGTWVGNSIRHFLPTQKAIRESFPPF